MELRRWAKRRQVVWQGAMEATLFSAWIYDTLKPYAQQLSMGHPAKMKAITAGKKKSDCLDARTIADLLRCSLCLPATCCPRIYAISDVCCVIETWWCGNRCVCRTGWPICDGKRRSVRQRAAASEEVLRRPDEEPAGSTGIGQRSLRMSRGSMEMFESTQKQLIKRLLCDPVLEQRLERLMSIDGAGPITALTWALEVADPHRFSSVTDAVSYCGLTPRAAPRHFRRGFVASRLE